METQLIFKRVGNYSMQQADPKDECCECGEVKFADILTDITPRYEFIPKKYICVECLLKNYFSSKEEIFILDRFQLMCEESLSPEVFEQFENVKKWLIKTRSKINDTDMNAESDD